MHLVASLPWWHPSTSALPWHGSILGVLMHLAGAARTSAMGVAGIGVHVGSGGAGAVLTLLIHSAPWIGWRAAFSLPACLVRRGHDARVVWAVMLNAIDVLHRYSDYSSLPVLLPVRR